jgi:hypothetical protein
VTPRSEPLLWLQLIALGAIPLELLLLLLLLAGADPGPLPGLERLLLWGLGVLAPAVLFWQRPPDCCSLLLIQVPLRGRSQLQRRLARLQESWTPKLLAVLGAALLLPVLWSVDSHAAFATRFSPLHSSNRFMGLLLSLPLLTVLLWQWQQLMQALWLLTRPASQTEATEPMSPEKLGEGRLCLGLPLLLLEPLAMEPTSGPAPVRQQKQPTPAEDAAVEQPAGSDPSGSEPSGMGVPEQPSAAGDASSTPQSVPLEQGGAVAIEPEQAAEESNGSELDEHIP